MLKFRIILFSILLTFSTSSVAKAFDVLSIVPSNVELTIAYDGESTIDRLDEITDDYFQKEPETYTVVAGDNLYRIAVNHNIPLESLMSWNNLTGDLIYPEDVLIVSDDGTEAAVVQAEENQQVATVFTPTVVEEAVEEEMIVTATAYTAYCTGCSGTTAYGIDLRSNPDQKVIAVDPRIIPLGTKVWVEGYGEAIAGDTGGAIKGNKIDVFIPSHENAMEWGVKKVKIKVLN
ncbi:3D domain-containing protein [Psychrobacillus sp.]|uniref:3D domain-containing protein n=1 Tax=Psychrobacillus sp. TaxID=1871623 RepID=UPI0028BE383A|nr:3D domain-containing protein [Psychrobacillus sp.]